MSDRIRHFFAAPEFADAEKTRVAQLLTRILWLVLAAAMVSSVALALPLGVVRRSELRLPLVGLCLSYALGSFVLQWLAHRGWVQVAAGALVAALWLTVTVGLWVVSGISSGRIVFLYPVVLVIAGVLLGQGGAAVFLGLSIAGMVGAYVGEHLGRVPVRPSAFRPADILGMSLMLAALVWISVRGRGSLVEVAQTAQENAAENERASRQLEAIQASVEHRVAERTRELTASTDALAAAVEIGRVAASAETVAALVGGVSARIAERFACYHVGLYLLDESPDSYRGATAVLAARSGTGGTGAPDLGYEVPMEEGSVFAEAVHSEALKLAFGSGVPRAAFALAQDALSMHRARLPDTAVEVVLPLIAGSSTVGVVDMHISDPGTFYQQSLDPLRMMANQIAVAIVAARRLQESQEALEAERERYRQHGQEGWTGLLQSGLVPGYRLRDRRIEPIGDTWYPEMDAALATERRIVGSALHQGTPSPAASPSGSTERVAVDGLDAAAPNRGAVGLPGASDGVEPLLGEVDKDHGEGAVAAVPLRIREQTIGVLHIRKRAGTGDWGADELELLDSLTDQLEAALESAWLYRETQRAAIQQRTMAEVGSRIREEVDIESVLARALAELGSALSAEQGAVLLTLEGAGEETA